MGDDNKKKIFFNIDGIQIYVGQTNIKYQDRDDLALMVLNPSNTIAGVFTQNKFCAAPVKIAQEHLSKQEGIRAIIINAGNANAGTGAQGIEDAQLICATVASLIDCNLEQVLPFSTGVILEPLPVDKIVNVIPKLKPVSWFEAAKSIMTTDTKPKIISKQLELEGETINFTGIAKGSGMICPNMATLLSFIATEATISQNVLEEMIEEIVADSFNSITVDGDTSTNDSFILIATGKTKKVTIRDKSASHYQEIKDKISEVALELAKEIVQDAEGGTKFITINVTGAATKEQAKSVAYHIAHSPLVKVAFYASDANLGRIICAIGNAEADFDANKIRLFLDNILVAENGVYAEHFKEEDNQRVMSQKNITIRVELQNGDASAKIYTCDLSHEYIDINASYRS